MPKGVRNPASSSAARNNSSDTRWNRSVARTFIRPSTALSTSPDGGVGDLSMKRGEILDIAILLRHAIGLTNVIGQPDPVNQLLKHLEGLPGQRRRPPFAIRSSPRRALATGDALGHAGERGVRLQALVE